jgi:MFS family permease
VSAVALLLDHRSRRDSRRRIWPVYLVIALSATARSFMRPAVFALSAAVVPRELYSSAVAWRTSSWHLAAVAGPAMGGLLYGFSGPTLAYGVVVIAMTMSLAAMAAVAHREKPAPRDEALGEA